MGLLPFNKHGELQYWPSEPAAARIPDVPLVPIIEADARERWHRGREAQFAKQVYGHFEQLDAMMDRLEKATRRPATIRQYRAQWARFEKYAAARFFDGSPLRSSPACPALVVEFLLEDLVANRSYSTIKQAASAISAEHVRLGWPDPVQTLEVRAMLQIARENTGKFSVVELPPVQRPVSAAPASGKLNGKGSGPSGGEHSGQQEEATNEG